MYDEALKKVLESGSDYLEGVFEDHRKFILFNAYTLACQPDIKMIALGVSIIFRMGMQYGCGIDTAGIITNLVEDLSEMSDKKEGDLSNLVDSINNVIVENGVHKIWIHRDNFMEHFGPILSSSMQADMIGKVIFDEDSNLSPPNVALATTFLGLGIKYAQMEASQCGSCNEKAVLEGGSNQIASGYLELPSTVSYQCLSCGTNWSE